MRNLSNFLRDGDGNITILTAFAIIPLILSVGLGIDYANATARESQLNGAADAAALAGLTPAMMKLTPADSKAQTTAFFNAQAAALAGVGAVTPTVTVTQPTGSLTRTVTVSYVSTSIDAFAQVLGMPTMALGGTSQAQARAAPNVDFWMMIDTSPSMAIAATTADITNMVNNTQPQGGCGFGCHEYNPAAEGKSVNPLQNPTLQWTIKDTTTVLDQKGLYYKLLDGKTTTSTTNNYQCQAGAVISANDPTVVAGTLTGAVLGSLGSNGYPLLSINGAEDNYVLARCMGVTLRIDLVNTAVQALMSNAPAKAITNNAQYRGALYTFDFNTHQLVGPTSSGLTGPTNIFTPIQGSPSLKSIAGTLAQLVIDHNGCLVASCTAPKGNGDQDTYFDQAMSDLNDVIPNPGNGTNTTGDTPQQVLYIVSDALPDTAASRSGGFYGVGTVPQGDWCTKVKARGIKIAFLYLTYNPLPTNGFYNSRIAPMQSQISPAALACASSASLFFEVNIGGDVNGAMQALFDRVTQTAILIK